MKVTSGSVMDSVFSRKRTDCDVHAARAEHFLQDPRGCFYLPKSYLPHDG